MAKEPERYDGSSFNRSSDAKHPDPKKHQYISFIKSGFRILGCVIAGCLAPANPAVAVFALAAFLGFAEVVGIYEELV